MSIFASRTQQTIALPFDAPHTVTIRRLTGRELDRAQSEHLKSMIAGRSARGWSGAFQRIIAGLGTPADATQALADPLAGFDRFAIVRAGLVAWSYPESLKPLTPSQIADGVTTDAIDDLDDDAVEFLARAILQLTKPALFLTEEAAAAAQKEISAAAPVV